MHDAAQIKKLILTIGGSFLVDCSKGNMDPMTEGMIKMWGVFAEMERNIISQRVKSGMENARAKGKESADQNLQERIYQISFGNIMIFTKKEI